METILSILLYVFTFLFGLFVDKTNKRKRQRIAFYCVWLGIFFCFGYKTGSDWRIYESRFNAVDGLIEYDGLSDFLFYDVFYVLKIIFRDFFLVLGILKLFYLWSSIRLLKFITPHWPVAISFLMPVALDFMLIDNPLRFMCAASLINLAMLCLLKKKWLPAIGLLIIAIFFHLSTVVIIVFLFVVVFNQFIYKRSKLFIIVAYIIATILFSGVGPASRLMDYVGSAYLLLGASGGYSEYMVESNSSVLSLGSFLQVFLFLFVVLNRDCIADSSRGRTIYSLAIVFYFLNRLFLIVPTGFRLALPFAFFTCAFFAELVRKKRVWKQIITLYFLVFLLKDIYFTYTYIPYSNSIPYIIMGHESYSVRDTYNVKAYTDRTGKTIDSR